MSLSMLVHMSDKPVGLLGAYRGTCLRTVCIHVFGYRTYVCMYMYMYYYVYKILEPFNTN